MTRHRLALSIGPCCCDRPAAPKPFFDCGLGHAPRMTSGAARPCASLPAEVHMPNLASPPLAKCRFALNERQRSGVRAS
eukprot:scaffold25496_cov130-Isochrysis_galbana.AAC.5